MNGVIDKKFQLEWQDDMRITRWKWLMCGSDECDLCSSGGCKHEGDMSLIFIGGDKPCRVEGELLNPQDVLIQLGRDTTS